MNEGDYIGDCINKMKLLAKELANADNFVSDKMLVTTILNNLPPSWDHIVTILYGCTKNWWTEKIGRNRPNWVQLFGSVLMRFDFGLNFRKPTYFSLVSVLDFFTPKPNESTDIYIYIYVCMYVYIYVTLRHNWSLA